MPFWIPKDYASKTLQGRWRQTHILLVYDRWIEECHAL